MNVYGKVYDNFIKEIDAIDNGVPMFEGGEPRYNISSGLSARVSRFNPVWNATETQIDVQEQFEKAKTLVGREFLDEVIYYTFVWWPARSLVLDALKNAKTIHSSGEILELKQFCPWKQHLFELEVKMNQVGVPKYVLYENKQDDYRVICVPVQPSSFICRKFLHKKWRGIRSDELQTVSGIETANFVHDTGFIGGCRTRDDALRMAVDSLNGDFID